MSISEEAAAEGKAQAKRSNDFARKASKAKGDAREQLLGASASALRSARQLAVIAGAAFAADVEAAINVADLALAKAEEIADRPHAKPLDDRRP